MTELFKVVGTGTIPEDERQYVEAFAAKLGLLGHAVQYTYTPIEATDTAWRGVSIDGMHKKLFYDWGRMRDWMERYLAELMT